MVENICVYTKIQRGQRQQCFLYFFLFQSILLLFTDWVHQERILIQRVFFFFNHIKTRTVFPEKKRCSPPPPTHTHTQFKKIAQTKECHIHLLARRKNVHEEVLHYPRHQHPQMLKVLRPHYFLTLPPI